MSNRLISSKSFVGLGLIAAVALILWAVADPGPEPPERRNLSDLPNAASSLALRSGVGAALGVSRQAMLALPELDEEAIQALLDDYLAEAGLEIDPAEVQSILSRYRQIAARAESLLASGIGQPSPQSLEQALRSLLPSGHNWQSTTGSNQLSALLAALADATVTSQTSGKAPAESSGVPADPLGGATGSSTQGSSGGPTWGMEFDGKLEAGSETFKDQMRRLEDDLSNIDWGG